MVRLDIQRWSSSFTPLGPTVCPSTSSPLYLNIWTSPPSSVWVCVFVCEPCVCMLWKVLLGYRQGESADINTEKGPRQVHPHQHERWSSAHSPIWILVSATGCSMTHTHKNMAHGSEGYNIHGSTCDPHLQLSHVSIVLVWTTLCCIKAKKEIMPCPFQHRQQSASPTDKEMSQSIALWGSIVALTAQRQMSRKEDGGRNSTSRAIPTPGFHRTEILYSTHTVPYVTHHLLHHMSALMCRGKKRCRENQSGPQFLSFIEKQSSKRTLQKKQKKTKLFVTQVICLSLMLNNV